MSRMCPSTQPVRGCSQFLEHALLVQGNQETTRSLFVYTILVLEAFYAPHSSCRTSLRASTIGIQPLRASEASILIPSHTRIKKKILTWPSVK